MDKVSSRPGGQLLPAEYHLDMTLLEAPERHQDLINELIAEVAEYNPDQCVLFLEPASTSVR